MAHWHFKYLKSHSQSSPSRMITSRLFASRMHIVASPGPVWRPPRGLVRPALCWLWLAVSRGGVAEARGLTLTPEAGLWRPGQAWGSVSQLLRERKLPLMWAASRRRPAGGVKIKPRLSLHSHYVHTHSVCSYFPLVPSHIYSASHSAYISHHLLSLSRTHRFLVSSYMTHLKCS